MMQGGSSVHTETRNAEPNVSDSNNGKGMDAISRGNHHKFRLPNKEAGITAENPKAAGKPQQANGMNKGKTINRHKLTNRNPGKDSQKRKGNL